MKIRNLLTTTFFQRKEERESLVNIVVVVYIDIDIVVSGVWCLVTQIVRHKLILSLRIVASIHIGVCYE